MTAKEAREITEKALPERIQSIIKGTEEEIKDFAERGLNKRDFKFNSEEIEKAVKKHFMELGYIVESKATMDYISISW